MEIEGAIDGYSLEPFALGGWARSRAGKPLYIEARCDDRTVAGTATHILRPDLGGAHGFRLEIPGEDLVNCKGLVSGRLAVYAVGPQSEQALPIYHIRLLVPARNRRRDGATRLTPQPRRVNASRMSPPRTGVR